MKEIKAYIKPHRLSDVSHALRGIEGLTGMSAVEIHGFGRSKDESERASVDDALELLAPHTKIEVVCHETLVEQVVETIRESARTGLRGDGKIYIGDVEDAIRIATGERGEDAV